MKLLGNETVMNNQVTSNDDGDHDISLTDDEISGSYSQEVDANDLPTALIVTNLDITVFNDDQERVKFEELLRAFDESAMVQYFKSFRRVRVNFSSSEAAACARIQLHQMRFGDGYINCYFAQPISPKESSNDVFLHPPAPVKQFLISPPASPPVGWKPIDEAHPGINYDLLSALANLSPGGSHELHPPSETQPGIIVHVCEDEAKAAAAAVNHDVEDTERSIKPKIQHTRCPDRTT